MIEVLKKIWRFAGEEQRNIRKSMVGGFFFAIFHMFQIAAIYVIVLALVDGSSSTAPAWQALGLLVVSILGRAIVNRFTQLEQTHAGYFMVANKRITIGDKLKRIPMGYFNDKSLRELTGITTTVLDEVESTGPIRTGMGLAHWTFGLSGNGFLSADTLRYGKTLRPYCSKAAEGRGKAGGGDTGTASGHERYQVLQPHRQG